MENDDRKELQMITIRNEKETDYDKVEKITRKAFYNLYVPGCVEHYLVHIMRNHEDFVPELDFVLEKENEIIGNIMYTKSKLIDKSGEQKQILTFGPVCILPEYQRMGYGKMLIKHSFQKAIEIGYDVVVIFGSPSNYVSLGFQSCKKYQVCTQYGKYPTAMLVKELKQNALKGKQWTYYESDIMNIDEKEAQRFDESLEKMEKKYQKSQEEFYIYSHSFVE